MVTITQTVEEYLPTTITKQISSPKTMMNLPPKAKLELPPKTKVDLPPQALGCPPDCDCKKTAKPSYTPRQIFFNAIGILVAIIATYLIVTTDSNLYLVFWVCYSVLRRMSKTRDHVKQD